MEIQTGYRMIEVKDGKVLSLFHGTNKSREIHLDQWNKANIKMVRDGGKKSFEYLSGWHMLPTRELAEKMFEKNFKVKTNRYIVRCVIKGNIRPKHPDGTGVGSILGDEILIQREDVSHLL